MKGDNVIRFPKKSDKDKKKSASSLPSSPQDYPDAPFRTWCPTCKHPLWIKDEEGYPEWKVPSIPRACRGSSWWKRTFGGGCPVQGTHLHQRCFLCRDEWVCLPPKKNT
jgi:hypothetical protein